MNIGDEVSFVTQKLRGSTLDIRQRDGRIVGVNGESLTVKVRGKLYNVPKSKVWTPDQPSLMDTVLKDLLGFTKAPPQPASQGEPT